jgi:hypothetical protein
MSWRRDIDFFLTKYKRWIIYYFMTKQILYNNRQMLEITSESKQRIAYWILKGVFKPADEGKGIGTTRRYSLSNLIEISLATSLSQVLKNVDFIRSVLNEIRKTCPQVFSSPEDGDMPANKSILTILIHSENSIIIHVHGLEEAKRCLAKYVPDGFKSFNMDLAHLRRSLIGRIGKI